MPQDKDSKPAGEIVRRAGLRTVRARLLLLAALLAAPLALAAVGLFTWSYVRERAAAEAQLSETAQAVALVVDRQLGQAEAFLHALATSPNLTAGDWQAFDKQVRESIKGLPGWVVLQAPSGQQIVNTRLPPGAPLLRSDPSRTWPMLAQGKSMISNLLIAPGLHKPVVTVTVPVIRGGKTIYALIFAMPPEALNQVLADQDLPAGWSGAILDRTGTVVAQSHAPELAVNKPAIPALLALVKRSPQGIGASLALAGGPVTIAWSRAPVYGWTFAVGVPSDQLAATARHAMIIALLLGALALIAGAALAVIVARGITRPVAALVKTAEALGRGENVLLATTRLQATDEVLAAMAAASAALREREDALRANEERFRTVLDSLPHMAIILTAEGALEYANRRYLDYFGAPLPDADARILRNYEADHAAILADRAAARAAGRGYSFEARAKRRDGAARWHRIQVMPLRRDGKIAAWFGTGVDIDDIYRQNELLEARVAERTRELQATQENLRQAQKLEAIGQLTGGVAHDFNNLLTTISASLDLLGRESHGAVARRFIDAAHRAVQRGAHLTQSLLAFARRQALRPETVNPNRLVQEFSELLHRAVGDGVELELRLAPALHPCRTDAAQFQAALLNLAVNARDAMPASGGRLTIVTENVMLDARDVAAETGVKPGPFVSIKVSDTGCGMAPEVIERAFEPFFTTKDVGKGSGLGLSRVYGFAKQSGGFARLTSIVGIGTTVEILLPEAQDEAVSDAASAPGEAPQATRRETVLVVEDDNEVRALVTESLTALGYHVLTAEDGVSALSALDAAGGVDLLFSDLSMPRGLRGDELARRALERRPRLKVLLTSGYATAAEKKTGAADFALLRKPYRQDELARAVRAALAG